MLIVVRHGDAGDKGRWEGPDLLRPLSPPGVAKPRDSCSVWRTTRSSESSPARRCGAVRPSSRSQRTACCRSSASPRSAWTPVPAELRSTFGTGGYSHAVLCTHGETIGQLFTQLAMDGLEVAEPLDWPKGSTWLLWRTQLEMRARYLAPLALDPVHAR